MKSAYQHISPTELARHLETDPRAVVVDVRSPAEFRSGHIPGARLVPVETLEPARFTDANDGAGFTPDQAIYLTCHAGKRAEKAAQILSDAGFTRLTLVEGGTEAWHKAGLPLRRCDSAISLERQVQIAVGGLLILKVLFGFTVHEVFFLAAAAIGAGLVTAGVTRWCGMAQLMARMPWNRQRHCGEEATT